MGFGTLKRSSICEEGWCQLMFDTPWCKREQVWSAIFILSKMHCVHRGQSHRKINDLHHFGQEKWTYQCKSGSNSVKAYTALQSQHNRKQRGIICSAAWQCLILNCVLWVWVLLDKQSSTSKELFFFHEVTELIHACCQNRNSTNECHSTHDVANITLSNLWMLKHGCKRSLFATTL